MDMVCRRKPAGVRMLNVRENCFILYRRVINMQNVILGSFPDVVRHPWRWKVGNLAFALSSRAKLIRLAGRKSPSSDTERFAGRAFTWFDNCSF